MLEHEERQPLDENDELDVEDLDEDPAYNPDDEELKDIKGG